MEEALSALLAKLPGYERILAKQRYLAGDQLTLADLFQLPLRSMISATGLSVLSDEQRFPSVAR